MIDKSFSGEAAAASHSVKEREYWLEKLSGEMIKSTFPYDNKKTANNTETKDHLDVRLSGELFSRLMWMSNKSDARLLTVLTAGLIVLLDKYTGNRDIVVGMPIYKQEIEGNFINTVVTLRCLLQEEMTFKNLLYSVKQTIDEAIKHQNYPIKTLLYDLNLTFSKNDFPLFDIVLMVKNIQNPLYVQHIPVNMTFVFFRTTEYLELTVEYNPSLYSRENIARIINHFSHLLMGLLFNVDATLIELDILPDQERKKLLEVFNNTRREYKEGKNKTIHQLFEEQVEQTPDSIAVAGPSIGETQRSTIQITYRELNKKANQLSHRLKEEGVETDNIVSIMTERSIEMIAGMVGVLKAGAAYLAIDPLYPSERIRYMLQDSNARILLETALLIKIFTPSNYLDSQTSINPSSIHIKPHHLAYIIYTSGTSGRPKGVLVQHQGIVNLVYFHKEEFKTGDYLRASQVSSQSFDAAAFEIWPCLLRGASLYIVPNDIRVDSHKMKTWLIQYNITASLQSTVIAIQILDEDWPATGVALKILWTAGDRLTRFLERPYPFRFYNLYGPTEDTIWTTWMEVSVNPRSDKFPSIGKPIANHCVYILGNNNELQPIGVTGELSISGVGIARGYLNRPELTADKFVEIFGDLKPHKETNRIPVRVYKTGDRTRWLPDGNIEFMDRVDNQVKIRGFRIELGEIERQLLAHIDINETTVIALVNNDGSKYLCAYIIASRQLSAAELREYLAGCLPDYMIPAYFVMLEKMPLSPNGKVDRKQLPPPVLSMKAGEYTPPRDRLETRLLEIWAEILGLDNDSIGIDADFFQLGGHSLTATLMSNRIAKELNVKVPMVEIFKSPQVRHLAEYIRVATEEKYIAVHPAEKKSYYAVTSAQLRLYILQQMDLDAVVYNIPMMNRLEGDLKKDILEYTFRQLIARHEPFRTSFAMVEGNPVQVIHEPGEVEFSIEYYDAHDVHDVQGEEHIKKTAAAIFQKFVRPFDMTLAPLLRVGLISLTTQQHILLVDIHHILTDIVAFNIVIDNFLALYNGRELAPLKIQYKDYAEWQHSQEGKSALDAQEKYWLQEFSGEIPILNLPTDFPRPAQQNFAGNVISFQLSREETASLNQLIHTEGITTFMAVLGLFNIFLAKIADREEIVVGTAVVGRKHADFEQVFGIFLNMLTLKNYPAKETTVRQFYKDLKEKTLAAFENQDYPYETLVEKVELVRDISRNPLFDAAIMYQKQVDAPVEIKENQMQGLRVSPYPSETKIARYDLTLGVVESGESDQLSFQLEYATSLFKEETILRFITYFRNVIASVTRDPGIKIMQVAILSEEERRQLLIDFNDTGAEYLRTKPIHQLIEEQAARTPGNDAVVFEDRQLTYDELARSAAKIAHYLYNEMHIQRGDRVGILMDRSVHIIPAMLGILKAGGAYVMADAALPEARIKHIANDAGITIFISETKHSDVLKRIQAECPMFCNILYLDNMDSTIDLPMPVQFTADAIRPNDLAYVAYTSGTTGVPKGIMIEHRSLVNFITGITALIDFGKNDTILSLTTISFDIFGLESLVPITCGSQVVIGNYEEQLDNMALTSAILKHKVSILQVTPSRLQIILSDDKAAVKLASLKYLLVGGETFPEVLLNKAREVVKGKIFNLYGPTETTIWSTAKEVSGKKSLNIGRPISNTKIYILDNRRQLVPIGTAGELCIGGDGLARGYFKNETLTQEKFIANPFSPGERIYRTGDLARWLSNGEIEHLGRMDNQVKIRGFRIELEEIEGRLLEIEYIEKAVVVEQKETNGGNYLCAYIVSGKKIVFSEIRQILGQIIPDYMIPSYFVQLEKIPLSPAGKIDRRALPVPTIQGTGEYIGPRNNVERTLTTIWCEELRLARISIDANFFQLGGHSLKVASMTARVHKELNVRLSMLDVFKTPFIRGLAETIKNMKQETYTALEPAEKKEYYELSSAQKRLYILQQMNLQGIGYNMPYVISLAEDIDRNKLARTFRELISRHDSLRTSFHLLSKNEEPVQRIHQPHDIQFIVDYYEVTDSSISQTGEIEAFVDKIVKPFDLSKAPLLRAGLIKIRGNNYILAVDMHHIITDATSQDILTREFLSVYAGETLLPLKIQYKDYSIWQNSATEKERIKGQESYWLQEFEGEIPILNIPTDYSRPSIQSFAGNVVNFDLSIEDTNALKELLLKEDATLFMVMLAIYNLFLNKITNQEDLIVGVPIAGRNHVDSMNIIGMFVNTLAFRNYPLNEKTFIEFLREVKWKSLDAFENQEYQFEDLVEKVSAVRDISRNPLFDVTYNYQKVETKIEAKIEAVSPHEEHYQYENRTSKFDMTLGILDTGNKFYLNLRYNTKLFNEETILRFAEYFKRIVRQVQSDPGRNISDIAILSPEEREQLLYGFNQTFAENPATGTIYELFAEQVDKSPNHIACVGIKNLELIIPRTNVSPLRYIQMTYRGLHEETNRLAQLLIAKGAQPGTIVGIMLEPSLEMLTGILAILQAGCAYMPINPDYPVERVNYMLRDSRAKMMVKSGIEYSLIIDEIEPISSLYTAGTIHHSSIQIAYVIYTSGTTGQSKGTLIENKNLVNYVNWFSRKACLSTDDQTILTSSFAFDLGYTTIYPSILNGGRLHLVPRETYLSPWSLLHYIRNHRITYIKVTPSLFSIIVESSEYSKENLMRLRLVVLGGEAIKLKDVETAHKLVDHLQIMNHYGPTEATIGCVAQFIDFNQFENYYKKPTIGHPVDNIKTAILDKGLKLVPIGVPGELCISGAGLGRGYLNRPELTAEKFIRHPYLEIERMYRTGDMAKWTGDGKIEFLGRIDTQVKISGYRIELAEVENQLLSHENIKEAAVIDREYPDGDKYLCAYILWNNPERKGNPLELKKYLSERLPEYMLPSYFVEMENIPLTANGKLNRRVLPEPEIKTGEKYIPPQNLIEEKLVEIWAGLLNLEKEQIGIDGNFFHMGGNSLKAIMLTSIIHKEFDISIPLTKIFEIPTLRNLSLYIGQAEENKYISLKPAAKKEYYKLSSAQRRFYVLWQINTDSTAYNIPIMMELANDFHKDRLQVIFEKLIARHESLRTSFVMQANEPMQKIHSPLDVSFDIDYFEVREEEIKKIEEQFVRPFDLSQAPLIRVGLLKIIDSSNILLMLDMHHIITDGISQMTILKSEFLSLYKGEELPPLRLQYKDYSEWWNGEMQTERLKSQEEYWLSEFSGSVPVLNLPLDYERPKFQSFEGKRISFQLDTEQTRALKKIVLAEEGTLFIVLLAIYNIFLSKISGQEDIVVGTTVAGRNHADLEKIFGLFLNTLALRNFPIAEKTFIDFVREVRDKTIKSFSNPDYQFEDLVAKVVKNKDTARNPLFDVRLTFSSPDNSTEFASTLKMKTLETIERTAKTDMTLDVTDMGERLFFALEYCTKLFREDTIQRFIDDFKNIVALILDNTEIQLGEIEIFHDFLAVESRIDEIDLEF